MGARQPFLPRGRFDGKGLGHGAIAGKRSPSRLCGDQRDRARRRG